VFGVGVLFEDCWWRRRGVPDGNAGRFEVVLDVDSDDGGCLHRAEPLRVLCRGRCGIRRW
jgi:hypothetical protein